MYVALLVALGAGPPLPGPFELISSEDGFKVTIPGPPRRVTSKVPLAGASDPIGRVDHSSDVAGVRYAVVVLDHPEGTLAGNPRPTLKAFRNQSLGKKGRLFTDAAGTFGKEKWPTREWTSLEDGGYVRTRVILVGDRLYGVEVIGPSKGDLTTPEAARLFESFRPRGAFPR